MIDESDRVAAFKELEAPFARAAAQIAAGGIGALWQPGFDEAPGQFIVEAPVGIVINLVILAGNTVVVFFRAVFGHVGVR